MATLTAQQNQPQYYQAPYRPISRSNDIRAGNTEWMKMLNRVDLHGPLLTQLAEQRANPSGIQSAPPPPPPKVSFSGKEPEAPSLSANPEPLPFTTRPKVSEYAPPYVDPSRNDTYYKRYMQLAQNVSYRHPDPGQPRERQGRSGGSWRHIKEVLGYTGSQVCFVDGLVRTYDKDVMKAGSSAFRNPPWVGQRSTPTYSANRHDVDFYSNHLRQEREKSSYIPGAVPNDRASAQPVSPTKYKGFYSYNS